MDKKVINTSFGRVKISDEIFEVIVDEGVTFTSDHVKLLDSLVEKHLLNKSFGYLSNRINDYSINLTSDLYKAAHKNLKATAIVCYNDRSYDNAKFQEKFYTTRPIEIFKDYEEAVIWLKSHL